MKVTDKIIAHLEKSPNQMADEWDLLRALYPSASHGDRANGGRMGCLRRIARSHERLAIIGAGASTIALIQ